MGTVERLHPETWSALPTDECASSLTATSGCAGAVGVPRRCPAVSRATMSAERLPADPPATKHPPRRRGKPACAASTAERLVLGHDDAGRLEPGGAVQRRAGDEHVEEQRRLGRRSRDEREEARAVARDDGGRQLVDEELQHRRAASLPSGRMSPASSASSDSTPGRRSRAATGSMRQTLPARRHDEVGHGLVVLEHRARHQAGGHLRAAGLGRRRPGRQASSARLATSWSVPPSCRGD